MDCLDEEQLVELVAENETPQPVREHLANCVACRNALAETTQMLQLAADYDVVQQPTRDDVDSNDIERIVALVTKTQVVSESPMPVSASEKGRHKNGLGRTRARWTIVLCLGTVLSLTLGISVWALLYGRWKEQESVRLFVLDDDVNVLSFSSDSRFLAAGSDYGRVHVWDVPTGELMVFFEEGEHCAITSLAFTPDVRSLYWTTTPIASESSAAITQIRSTNLADASQLWTRGEF